MKKTHYTPVHPGAVLKDELDEVGLTQSALAKHIGKQLMKYVVASEA